MPLFMWVYQIGGALLIGGAGLLLLFGLRREGEEEHKGD